MPNIKVYVDQRIFHEKSAIISLAIEELRDCIMHHLAVSREMCQLAVLPVLGTADQAAVNAEIQIIGHPDRTLERIEALGQDVRRILATATGERCDFRCMQLSGSTYFVLR